MAIKYLLQSDPIGRLLKPYLPIDMMVYRIPLSSYVSYDEDGQCIDPFKFSDKRPSIIALDT